MIDHLISKSYRGSVFPMRAKTTWDLLDGFAAFLVRKEMCVFPLIVAGCPYINITPVPSSSDVDHILKQVKRA